MICDFCSSPEVIGGYPTENFILNFYGSYGGFAVCAECKNIIERNDRKTLLKRSIETCEHEIDIPEVIISDWINSLHSMFFEHRTGCFELR